MTPSEALALAQKISAVIDEGVVPKESFERLWDAMEAIDASNAINTTNGSRSPEQDASRLHGLNTLLQAAVLIERDPSQIRKLLKLGADPNCTGSAPKPLVIRALQDQTRESYKKTLPRYITRYGVGLLNRRAMSLGHGADLDEKDRQIIGLINQLSVCAALMEDPRTSLDNPRFPSALNVLALVHPTIWLLDETRLKVKYLIEICAAQKVDVNRAAPLRSNGSAERQAIDMRPFVAAARNGNLGFCADLIECFQSLAITPEMSEQMRVIMEKVDASNRFTDEKRFVRMSVDWRLAMAHVVGPRLAALWDKARITQAAMSTVSECTTKAPNKARLQVF